MNPLVVKWELASRGPWLSPEPAAGACFAEVDHTVVNVYVGAGRTA